MPEGAPMPSAPPEEDPGAGIMAEEMMTGVAPRASNTMKIFVELPDGKIITLSVSAFDSVQSVKTMIQDKEGYPANQQSLLRDLPTSAIPDSLEDRRTMADCNVQEGTTLRMIMIRNQGRGIDNLVR